MGSLEHIQFGYMEKQQNKLWNKQILFEKWAAFEVYLNGRTRWEFQSNSIQKRYFSLCIEGRLKLEHVMKDLFVILWKNNQMENNVRFHGNSINQISVI